LLSKSKITKHRQCPRLLWLDLNRRDLAKPDDTTIARMAEGNRVGDVSRQLHPGGVLIDTLNLKDALARTQQALSQQSLPVFEPAFVANEVLVRVDLLLPENTGYRLVEVKSATEVKDYHYEDAAVQYWVMTQAGVKPTSVALGHINNKFEYTEEGNYQGLITETDITASVKERFAEVPAWVAAAQATSEQTELPHATVGQQCRSPFECAYTEYCQSLETTTEYPVSILPRISAKQRAEFAQQGIVDVRDIPDNYLEKENHEIVRKASLTGETYLNPRAKEALGQLGYPRYYLDFETVAPAVPRWLKSRPYQQIPFQWSCHQETAAGAELLHTQYLHPDASDPRRAFAESLLQTLGEQGPILVYNAGFERTRIEELAECLTDLAPSLLALVERIVDLLPLAQKNYYHPSMLGSWSIKAVLPTVSALDYASLKIGNGGLAQVAYIEMIATDTPANRRAQIYEDLSKYCYQDTLAMVHVAKRLSGESVRSAS
jgi:hypothetical protein